jgi:formate hydrogenlyase subunit 3/multisubunit Na+/H+ antiporter MnhD subunit/multisubunit Na+/H+ antiporter MnhB subunit
MIGLALAESLVLFFVFWELTTVTSFLLIGMQFEEAEARRGAIQSFLVTGAGGLALLGGIGLVGARSGTFNLSELAGQAGSIAGDPVLRVALMLMLVGAFAKSAQFPLHFWLPGAMAAPTPVSAFLHSAAMVKAGILLIGRLLPIFGTSDLWVPTLATVGLATYVITGWLALRATDLKELLAYSTSGFLGLIVAFYGFAGRQGSASGELLHILNHATYKAALFFLVGWLDEAAGTRDLLLLRSRRVLGRSRAAAVLFAVGTIAMAGLPMTLGFVSKEEFYGIVLGGDFDRITPAIAAVTVGSALMVAYSLKILIGVFSGGERREEAGGHPPESISRWLLIVPGILLMVQVVGGLVPDWLLSRVVAPGTDWPSSPAVWHHIDAKLAISLVAYGVGAVLYLGWELARRVPAFPGPQQAADGLARASGRLASRFGDAVQAGGYPRYLSVILLAVVALTASELARGGTIPADLVGPWGPDLRMGIVFAAIAAVGGWLLVVMPSRLAKVLMLSVLGLGVIGVFVLYRAPDLALTQILTDTISLIMLLLVLRNLPEARPGRRGWARVLFHGSASVGIGVAMAALTWGAASHRAGRSSGDAHLGLALPEGGGSNVVNVILTDIRAADTLGEVAVLAIAALGVVVLHRASRKGRGGDS